MDSACVTRVFRVFREVEGTPGLLSTLPVMAQKCAKRTVLERPISCPFNANRERRRRVLAAPIGLDVLAEDPEQEPAHSSQTARAENATFHKWADPSYWARPFCWGWRPARHAWRPAARWW